MLENKIIPPTVTATKIVFDSGWVREIGTGVTLQRNLYKNTTGRMLMWSFEMVSIKNQVSSSFFQPYFISPSGSAIAVGTEGKWIPATTATGAEWYLTSNSSTAEGHYRFANFSGNGSKWNMLPAGFSVDSNVTSIFTANYTIDYKLTVVEEDTSLLVNRN